MTDRIAVKRRDVFLAAGAAGLVGLTAPALRGQEGADSDRAEEVALAAAQINAILHRYAFDAAFKKQLDAALKGKADAVNKTVAGVRILDAARSARLMKIGPEEASVVITAGGVRVTIEAARTAAR
jgi:hypothetical protein